MATVNKSMRTPDCVTKVQLGNTILTVSGFFKETGAETAVEKMMKVLEAESTNIPCLVGQKEGESCLSSPECSVVTPTVPCDTPGGALALIS